MKSYQDQYTGEWANNTMLGQGEYIWNDADIYQGSFNANVREGKG